jgi:hypothetical protein
MLAIPLLVTLAAGPTAAGPFAQRPLLQAERARVSFWPTIGSAHARDRRTLRGRVAAPGRPPKGALEPRPRDMCPAVPDGSLIGVPGSRLDVRQLQCWIDSWGPAFILDGGAR